MTLAQRLKNRPRGLSDLIGRKVEPIQPDIGRAVKELYQITRLQLEVENLKKTFSAFLVKSEAQFKENLLSVKDELGKMFTQTEESLDDLAKGLDEAKRRNQETVFIHKGDKGDKPVLGIDYTIPEPKKGYTPIKGVDYFDGLPGLSSIGEPGLNGSPDKPQEIADKLNTLEEKVEMKVIKGLNSAFRNLRTEQRGGKLGGGQGSWKQKQLSGTINSSNKVFTFTGESPAQYSERIFLNYLEQNPFTDYTISGNTITYTTAPDTSLSSFPHLIRYM